MSKTSVSIIVYSTYLGSAGAGAAFIPNTLLPILGLPTTNEVWVRLFGALALLLAAKGFNGALLNLLPSMQFDVYTRTCFAVFLAVLIIIGLSPPILIILAIIDIVAAVWTQLAIRADRRQRTVTA
jgi:hypothetical protein